MRLHTLIVFTYLFFTFSAVCCYEEVSRFTFATNDSLTLITGKKNFEMLQKQVMNYGDCWKNAILKLQQGCKNLSDELQGRLALDFTNCFLEKLEYKTYPCNENLKLSECLKDADMKAFSSYTEFFTHTQTICFYLQNQIWQQNAEKLISDLTFTSLEVSELLSKSRVSQEEMLKLQHVSIEKQQALILAGEHINRELETSKQSVKEFVEQVKDSAAEQKTLIFGLFEKVHQVTNFFVGELAGFYSAGFFIIALLVSFVFTATKRTSNARFFLFVVTIADYIIENWIAEFCSSYYNDEAHVISEMINTHIWNLRKLAFILGLFIYLWYGFTYKDIHQVNNKRLNDIDGRTLQTWKILRIAHPGIVGQINGESSNPSLLNTPSAENKTTSNEIVIRSKENGITEISTTPNGLKAVKAHSSKSMTTPRVPKQRAFATPDMITPIQEYEGRYMLRSRTSRASSVESSFVYAAVSVKSKRARANSRSSKN